MLEKKRDFKNSVINEQQTLNLKILLIQDIRKY
jgi:hypothetical protein